MDYRNGDSTAEDQRWRLQETVAEQLSRIAQETGGNCRTSETAEGFEAVLEYWMPGDDDPFLRIAARFNDPGASITGMSNWLYLALERPGENTTLLTLAWRNDIYDAHLGINAIADHSEGLYASGNAVSQLRRDVKAALAAPLSSASRSLVVRMPAPVVDATFEPVRISAVAMPAVPAQTSPDVTALRQTLGALPDNLAVEAQETFRRFMEAAARNGTLTPEAIAAFVQEGMEELYAFRDAHLNAKSPGTAIGVGLKGMALTGALIVAMGGEFMTGVYAFGPVIGHSWQAWPLAGVGCFLIGSGLIPLAAKNWERGLAYTAAVLWGLTVASLTSRNAEFADGAQAFFPMQQVTVDARARERAARLKLAAADEKITAARKDKAAAGEAYLGARKNRPAVLGRADAQLKDAERAQEAASREWVEADSDRAQAMKSDPSRAYAQGVMFLLSFAVNALGPMLIGKVLERAAGVHAAGLAAARGKWRMRNRARALRRSRKTQEAKAQVLLTELSGLYAQTLRSTRRFSEAEIERRTRATFGDSTKIVGSAVDGFRDGIGIRRRGFAWLRSAAP